MKLPLKITVKATPSYCLTITPTPGPYVFGQEVTISGNIKSLYLFIYFNETSYTLTRIITEETLTSIKYILPSTPGQYFFTTKDDCRSTVFTITYPLTITPAPGPYTIGQEVTISGNIKSLYLFIYFNETSYTLIRTITGETLTSIKYTFSDPPGQYFFTTNEDKRSIVFTVSSTPTATSFHISSKMDDFFKNYSKTYIVTPVDGFQCLTAYGSNGAFCSSEALSYCLDFYVYSYVLGIEQSVCREKIIYILNTIFTLTTKITKDEYKNLIVPTWYFYTNCNIVDNNSEGSATDSNIEIMTSLLYLYLYLYENNLDDESTGLKTFTFFNFSGISFSATKSLKTTLKDVISLFAFNLLSTTPASVGYDLYQNSGPFSKYANGNVYVTFGKICTNCYPYYAPPDTVYQYKNNENLINGKFGDYINFSGYILLAKYLEINPNITFNFTSNKPGESFGGTPYSVAMPTFDTTTLALTNYLNYINNSNFGNTISGGDGESATFNRLSYQLVNLYIFLKQGCKLYDAVECKRLWEKVVPTTTGINITYISELCKKMIEYEIDQNKLLIDYTDKITGKPRAIGVDDETNANGFYRQLSYHIYKELSDTTFTLRPISNDIYYFERYSLDRYFGFTSTDIPHTFDTILNEYESNSVVNLDYFTVRNSTQWNKDCLIWLNNNGPYFMFSCCTLHQINYLLYQGIL